MRIIAVAALFAAVSLAGCSDAATDKYGGELFGVTCAHCHGSELGGGIGPPLGAGSNAANLTDDQITGVIRIGPGAMPAFEDRLTDQQIESLVGYLREQQGP